MRPVRLGHKRTGTLSWFLWVDLVAGSELQIWVWAPRIQSGKWAIGSYVTFTKSKGDACGFLKQTHISSPLTVALLGTQVYGNHPEDEMGTVGYFPSNLVEEQHVYQEATKEVPTTVSVSDMARERPRSWGKVKLEFKMHHVTYQMNQAKPPISNGGFSETVRFGRAFIPTINVGSILNFLHWPPFCFRWKLSMSQRKKPK